MRWACLPLGLVCLSAATDEIRSTLFNRVDESKRAVGIVVGTIDSGGRQVIAAGRLSKENPQAPGGDTVYEIGSITKVFTSLALADMVERGEVKLDDPVAKFLPEGVKMPSRNGRQITLLDLSTQTSGLPRMPSNLKPADPLNPYADYGVSQLYEFLSGYTLTRDIGTTYEYSNLAVGLLGHALARRTGMSYEELVRKRILEPLRMDSTSITLSGSQKKRLAPGYNELLAPAKNWDIPTLAGAGALRSTVNDMLKFLAANLELTDTPLKSAMRRMRSVRRSTGQPDLDIAMGWHIWKRYGTEVIWHNGGTGGYRTYAGFDPAKKKAAVVLCNTVLSNDDLGNHLIAAQFPVEKLTARKERIAVQLDPTLLETYVGEYELSPAFKIGIAREGERLFAQATGQPKIEIFAEKEGEFFLKVTDAQISFVKGEAGKVTALVLHQMGRDQKAVRK